MDFGRHPAAASHGPDDGTEEEDVLRFWDSPARDQQEPLFPLIPAAQGTVRAPPPSLDETAQVFHLCRIADGNVDVGDGAVIGDGTAAAAAAAAALSDPVSHLFTKPAGPILFPRTPEWKPHSTSWPACANCSVLRDVTHGDARSCMRLSIHGHLGNIRHAVLSISSRDKEKISMDRTFIADFEGCRAETVKRFLADYSRMRHQEGKLLIKDSDRAFYDILSVNMDYGLSSTSVTAAALRRPQQRGAGYHFSGRQTPRSLGSQPLQFCPPVPASLGLAGDADSPAARSTSPATSALWVLPEQRAASTPIISSLMAGAYSSPRFQSSPSSGQQLGGEISSGGQPAGEGVLLGVASFRQSG